MGAGPAACILKPPPPDPRDIPDPPDQRTGMATVHVVYRQDLREKDKQHVIINSTSYRFQGGLASQSTIWGGFVQVAVGTPH